MSTTKNLTDTHLVILSQAAHRPALRVLPTPNLKSNGGDATRALKSLLRRGLITEQRARKSDQEWRRNEDGAPLTLVITPAGLAAIGLAGDQVPEASGREGAALARESNDGITDQPVTSGGSSDTAQRPGTKGAAITALLRQDAGATLAELTAASGWQAHSVRGFLSGTLKKKLGYDVTSERGEDGARRYRIAA